MKNQERDYILYYLDQLSLKLKNNISEMQQGLSHIAEISKSISQEVPPPTKVVTFESFSVDKQSEKPPESLIRIKEACSLVGVSRSTLYKMIGEGRFPKPLELGSRCKAWQRKTVINWIVGLN